MMYTIQIRPRRQTTIPQELLDQLKLSVGDNFLASINDGKIVLVASKKKSLDAFKVLQKAMQLSKISEDEMLKSVEQIRKDMYEKNASAVS